jgi:hypothetical protein
VKPLGILAALAAIGAGGAVYMAVGQAAAANPDCTLIVPANPTSAAGLATPYQLVATNAGNGPCHEANADQSAFVQGAIITPNGQITLYNPLVIDQGTQPITAPVAANVPAGSTVGLWFGFNGANLTLRSAANTTSLAQGNCVNGSNGSIFGQFAYCNAPAFFQAANAAVAANRLQIPALGTAKDGLPCPTVRSFALVDMDQSDNVVTHYLTNGTGRTGLPNAATKAAIQNAGQTPQMMAAATTVTDLANGSDNRLLDALVDPTLGCTPWTVPEQTADGAPASALPLNELQAAANQKAPVALVPMNDPMVLVGNNTSTTKTNLYRAGVDQAAIGAADNGSGQTYCQNLYTNPAGIARVFKDQAILVNGPTADAAAGNNLFTFLANRAAGAFDGLGCGNFGLKNPITLTMDGNGVTTAATLAGAAGTGTGASAAPSTAASAPAAGGTSAAPSAAPTASASAPAATPTPTPTRSVTRTWWWWHRHR